VDFPGVAPNNRQGSVGVTATQSNNANYHGNYNSSGNNSMQVPNHSGGNSGAAQYGGNKTIYGRKFK
jgi:hypothetical protein